MRWYSYAGADSSLVKLKDVGRVELGAEDYTVFMRFNGNKGVGIGVYLLPGANALQVYEGLKMELEHLAEQFPPGLKYAITLDTARVVDESIHEVVKTLLEAVVIVVIVMFIFLQDWRSTLIPFITIPVSLVGTFMFTKLLGFSINTLTLFSLVLATGLVVDDAIIVVENIAHPGFGFTGNGPNKAVIYTTLKPLAERTKPEQSVEAVINKLSGPLGQITGATIILFNAPAIQGIGNVGGFQFNYKIGAAAVDSIPWLRLKIRW